MYMPICLFIYSFIFVRIGVVVYILVVADFDCVRLIKKNSKTKNRKAI